MPFFITGQDCHSDEHTVKKNAIYNLKADFPKGRCSTAYDCPPAGEQMAESSDSLSYLQIPEGILEDDVRQAGEAVHGNSVFLRLKHTYDKTDSTKLERHTSMAASSILRAISWQ